MRLRAEFVEDDEERSLWLSDLDELERIADSAILLVREELGKASPETVWLTALSPMSPVSSRIRTWTSPSPRRRAGERQGEPSRACPRAAQSHDQCRDPRPARSPSGSRGAKTAKARVIIEDEGAGIPPELLGQVFEPFFRVDPGRAQNIAGAGLGLTIARQIVQRAGGDIKISNRTGGGLKQVVELTQVEELAAVKSAAE